MNISPLNGSLNFGKRAVATCTIKRMDTQKRKDATLYKMHPNNINDFYDVMNSKNTGAIKLSFERSTLRPNNHNEFYVLAQNDTREIISCAEITQHYSQDKKHEGLYTLINGLQGNKNYANPLTPMVAYIANKAEKRCDKHIVTVEDGYISRTNLKREKFSEIKDDVWVLPEKRYKTVAAMAEERNNLEYLA